MRFLAALCTIVLIFTGGAANAQRIIQSRVGPHPATMVEPVYTEAERAAGIQGDVTVRGMIQPDGSMADVVIAESSRSAVLDDASVVAVRQWTFLAVEVAVPYQVQIEFRKDDLNTLATKTCTDLNVDVAYFRQTFPETSISGMPLKDVLVGLMLVMGPGGMTVENIRRSSDAFDRTVDWCASRSDELVLEHYLRLAR